MSYSKQSKTKKFVAGLLGLTVAFSFVFGGVVTPAQAATVEELTAQIQSLLAMITTLQAQLSAAQGGSATTGGSTGGYVFTKDLKQGDTNADVKQLQMVLNSSADTKVAASGAGSPGSETMYFGPATKAAVVKFQTKKGISPASGYVGPLTRNALNATSGTTGGQTGTGTGTGTGTVPSGSGLTVTAGTQPAAGLAPENAARVPFTRVTLTAGPSDVTVNSITVERTGLAADSAISGVVLLDEKGTQIGIAKTLNSNHQAAVGEPFTVKAGTSKTVTIAANMDADLDAEAGQVASFAVIGVNTSATVAGSLPITGASMTVNGTLTIGGVTLQRGGTDPASSQTKEIGVTGYTFSAIRITANSQEKVWLKSIRWNQTGSAASGDLANIKTYVDGVAYDTSVSADGKYYTASFGSGILIDKGFSKDISIKGDIIGGSGRTVDFDLAKRTDIDIVGDTYGYGLIPPQTGSSDPTDDSASFSSVEDPWYDAAQVTVSAGTLTVSADTGVAAQNIAVNANNQPLGGFLVDVRGEPISVGSIVFRIQATGDEAENITNISLVDGNGAVLAGPVDGVSTASNSAHGTVTFSSSITFPVGVTKLKLLGKLGTAFVSNDTVAASTTPSSNWTTVKGQTSGNTVSPTPSSGITGSTMTVKAGALAVSQSSQPSARNVIAGAKQFEFARYVLDAGQSGEDVRVTSFPVKYSFATNSANHLTGCKLYDGSTAVTTGSNEVNPASGHTTGDDLTFTFDGTGLIIGKGTSKTLSVKCDVSTSATSGTFTFGNDDNASTFTAASGVGSGQTIAETWTSSSGQAMTSATGGSFTVAEDTAITYKMAQAGAKGVVLGQFRFSAGTPEDLMLKAIAVQLDGTASNTPADLAGEMVTFWQGSTKVGEAKFVTDFATTTLSSSVLIPKGEAVTITVKGDLSAQNASEGNPGAFIAISVDGNAVGLTNGTYAVGVDSGTNISPSTTSDVTSDGLRVFRTVPTVTVTSNGGTLAASADLYKFTVTNPNSRDIALSKVTFAIATTGGAVTGFTLYGDGVAANSSAVDAPTGTLEIYFNGSSSSTVARTIPANSSKTYVLKAATAVDTASVSESLNINLDADESYPSLSGLMGTLAGVDAAAGTADNLIWSPISTSTLLATDVALEAYTDWTNSYGMPGFPSPGTDFPVQTWTRSN